MPEVIDLATIGGVAAFTIATIEVIKRVFLKNVTEKPWYGMTTNVMTVGVAVGAAVAYRFVGDPDLPWETVIMNGVGGAVTAIGGYEGVANLIRILFNRHP